MYIYVFFFYINVYTRINRTENTFDSAPITMV